jgi:hypothetical protein
VTPSAIPERHRRAVRALQARGPAAPAALARRIALGSARPASRAWRLPALAIATATATAIVLVVALSLDGGSGVMRAADIAGRPATLPTPGRDPTRPALLDRGFEGVVFPNWTAEFGWMAEGARTDEIDGRRAETVFYTHQGHRISYTVIAGEPLDPPSDAMLVRAGGLELHRFRDGERDVVTFERGGRTCVLAGHVIHHETLVELASWRGQGSIPF